jgi:hypothetical protein
MDGGPIFEVVLTAVSMGAVSAVFWWRVGNWRRGLLRKLAKVPRQEVKWVRDGERVRVVGVVESTLAPLEAPLSGRPCVAWVVVAYLGGPTRRPETVDRTVDLIVRDSTGIAFAVSAQAALVLDKSWTHSNLEQPPGKLGEVLSKESWANRKNEAEMRFEEGIIRAGDEVALIGKAHWQADPEGGGGSYREPPKRLALDGAIITNLPKARR